MTASVLSNWFGNQILADYLINAPTWLGLHTADPTVLGDPATEVGGGDYARQPASWSPPGSKTVATTTALTWVGLPGCTVLYLAAWTALSGGHLLVPIPLASPIEVPASGHFLAAAGDIAVTL